MGLCIRYGDVGLLDDGGQQFPYQRCPCISRTLKNIRLEGTQYEIVNGGPLWHASSALFSAAVFQFVNLK